MHGVRMLSSNERAHVFADAGERGDAYRVLFESNPRPQAVMDWETLAFVAVNDAACALYGWSREELLSMSAPDLRVPEERDLFERFIEERRVTEPRNASTRGWHHRTKSGRVIHVDLAIVRVTFRGRAARLLDITDITNSHLAERRFRLLVEHSADGMAILDEERVVQYVSPAVEDILGLRPDEIVGRCATFLTHPGDRERTTPPRPGETLRRITRQRHRDGTWRWVEATSTNLTNEPAVRGYIVNFRDVTERTHAEQVLRRSEANFRILIERSPTAVFVHRRGQIIYANSAMVAMLGHVAASDLVGRGVIDLFDDVDHATVHGQMDRTRREGASPPVELRMRHRDGRLLVVEAQAVLLDFDGAPANVVLVSDVTERREMFARIAVADRMLSVGTLAAGVAHEINNPLAYVMANLALLGKELPGLLAGDASGRPASPINLEAMLHDAQEGAARVSGIVQDLRALSRADDEPYEAVDVATVLESSMKMAHHEIRHRARVVLEVDGGLPRITANATRLGQVFLNILVNAAQAIPLGHPSSNEIRVRARASEGDTQVLVEIEDTGAGIPASVIGRIFDPFFTTKPIGVGTGLGLSICHQIVQSFGGAINVTSEPGKGSCFRLMFPVKTNRPSGGESPPGSTPAPAPVARVLMIDDEPALGRSTRLLLQPQFDVVPVTRAREALERLARGEEYDAILCDLMMPEMSGIQFHGELARIAPEHLPRVVFVTGGAFTDESRDFLAGVANPHIEKPFTEVALRDALHAVTGRAG